MAAIHQLSSATIIPELDIFSVPPTQMAIEKCYSEKYRPLAPLRDDTKLINFYLSTAIDEYLILRSTELYLKIKLQLKNEDPKTPITSDDWKVVAPINNMLHSMINQINLYINEERVTSNLSAYAYKAYIEKRFAYSVTAKETIATSALFVNEADDLDEVNTDLSEAVRHDDSDKSTPMDIGKEIELADKLHLDLFWQDRLLLGRTNLKIEISFNDPKFYLIFPKHIIPKILVTDCYLKVTKAKVHEALVNAHNKALKIATAKYPFVHAPVKFFTITKGSYNFCVNAHQGTLPRSILLGFVSHDAYNGVYNKNPFKFNSYNANRIIVYANDAQYEYVTNFKKKHYLEALRGLHQATKQNELDTHLDIDRNTYKEGNTLFGFNLAADLSESFANVGYMNFVKTGQLRIQVNFDEPLRETINLILYLEFDKLLEITETRTPRINLE